MQSQLAASSLLKLGHCDFSATPHHYSRTSKGGRAQAMKSAANFPRKKRTAVSDFAPETKRTIYLEAYANNCFRQSQH
jgi:hypothetical protein